MSDEPNGESVNPVRAVTLAGGLARSAGTSTSRGSASFTALKCGALEQDKIAQRRSRERLRAAWGRNILLDFFSGVLEAIWRSRAIK